MLALGDFHHPRHRHLRAADEVIDLVFAEQELDSFGHLAGDAARAIHHLGEIETDVLGRDAEYVAFLQGTKKLRALQQGLGRNTTPVEASAARALQLDAGDFFSELPGANRARIARRTAANDNQVVFRSFSHPTTSARLKPPSNGIWESARAPVKYR